MALVFLPLSAAADDRAEKQVADIPGEDIFGFTSPTDVGKRGELEYFNENDGRVGKRQGSYGAVNSKFALGYTFADNWWVVGAFFTAVNQSSHVASLPDVDRIGFDGLSIQVMHRILERSSNNPFAMTLSIEPRWGRIDGLTGLPSASVGSTFKLFADSVIVPEKLYWGGNLQYTVLSAQDPLVHGQSVFSAQLLSSVALTWQTSPSLFFGGEARFFLL